MSWTSYSENPVGYWGTQTTEPVPAVRISEYHVGVLGWWLIDATCAIAAVLGACWLSPNYGSFSGSLATDRHFSPLSVAAVYALLFPVLSHVFGLHNPLMRRQRLGMAVKYLGVAVLAVVLLASVDLFLFYSRIGRHILVNTVVLSSAAMILLRLGFWRLTEEQKRRVVVLGTNGLAERMRVLIEKAGLPYEVIPVKQLACIYRPDLLKGEHPMACYGAPKGYCRGCGAHEVVACYAQDTPQEQLTGLSHVQMSGLQVSDYSGFIERTFFKVPVEQIGPDWWLQIDNSGDYVLYRAAKRFLDIALSGAGLMLVAPFLALVGCLIKLESRGPVFYSQVRVGQFGRPFRIWKLRSMRTDAERHGAEWARKNDRRVTRIGRILRLTRFDEVPQFWNVLHGEMSFVGPRPERPEFVKDLAREIPYYMQRHLLKPGISGWAQINYPYGATKEDALNKLKYDLYYVKHASLMLDVQVFLRTVGAVMKGAR